MPRMAYPWLEGPTPSRRHLAKDTLEDVSEFELRTRRLVLREWRERDRAPFAEMNADPTVMKFFPTMLDAAASDALIERFKDEIARVGFCPWAVETMHASVFIGFVGLHEVPSELPFSPAIEIGWRLARPFWGNGYATEAGVAALDFGFGFIGLEEIVSFTSAVNLRSQRVMMRLGMTRDPLEDFDHPGVAENHLLRPHVLFRVRSGNAPSPAGNVGPRSVARKPAPR